MIATPDIPQDLDPADWRRHRFGLPEARWAALGGRVFWITGAGTGYGQALAMALAAAGGTTFLSGRRPEKLAETVVKAARFGVPDRYLIALPCDVTEPNQVAAAAETIRSRAGSLHGLVNNAALPQPPVGPSPFTEITPALWSALLATNLTGPWLVTRAALPLMLKGGVLRVLFISSEAGWAFTPGMGPYNVGKAALNNLGASFAAECARAYPAADVQINVLVPGEARTEMNQGSSVSPYAVVGMALMLLSHPPGGPNGCFFHRDGRHLSFGYAAAYDRPLHGGVEAADTSETARHDRKIAAGAGRLARVLRRMVKRR